MLLLDTKTGMLHVHVSLFDIFALKTCDKDIITFLFRHIILIYKWLYHLS